MSVLLLTNPFAAPNLATTGQSVSQASPGMIAPTTNTTEIAPANDPAETGRNGSSTAYSGAGAGAGGAAAQRPVLSRRPGDATPNSILAAQFENLPLTPAEIARTMPDPLPTSPFLKGAGKG